MAEETAPEVFPQPTSTPGEGGTPQLVPPRPARSGNLFLRRAATFALFIATILIAIVLVVWLFDLDLGDESHDVIVQFAAEHRRTDLRFPGAEYRPIRPSDVRGGDYDFSAADLSLLEESLQEQRERNPSDSDLLFALAEIHLARMQPMQAIDILERLRPFSPKDPKILAALGFGYYLRARGSNQAKDLLRSLDLFEEALSLNPRDPVLLFNAGTVAERAKFIRQAKQRYILFLSLEPDNGWAAEIKLRLRSLDKMGQ